VDVTEILNHFNVFGGGEVFGGGGGGGSICSSDELEVAALLVGVCFQII